jgi:hypothetical protein
VPLPPTPPPLIYQYVTLGTMRQELANRLYDSNQVFWSTPELNVYIVEALRTWNAMTNYWRNDFLFAAQQGVTWYDLTDPINLPNSLRQYSVTDVSIYETMQYHLLEPATGIFPSWPGSAQFTSDDFLNAVARRRDELLSTTGCTVTLRTVPAVAGRIILPDTVVDVRRMAYLPAIGSPSTVWPEDTWGEQSFNPAYVQQPAGTPFTYLLSTQPPISFDTDRPPGAAGSYELLTIEAGTIPVPSIVNYFTVPDDWTHLIKWGALSDLLSRESNAKDVLRSQYCEGRYRLGMKLLEDAAALLAARIDNVPVQIDSVRSADYWAPAWEAASQAPPTAVYYAGLNFVALAPVPDAGTYAITATVVTNAPIPQADPDLVQLARDDYDCVLDYAQHLAAFKQGGGEFVATFPLFQRFMAQASIYNRKLGELGEFTSMLLDLGAREKDMNPITMPSDAAGGSDAS